MSTLDDRLNEAWSRSVGAWSPLKPRTLVELDAPAPAPVFRLERLAQVSRLVLELGAGDRAAVLELLAVPAAIAPAPSNRDEKIIAPVPASKPRKAAAPAELADYPLAAPGKIWRSKQAAPRITVTFGDGTTIGAPVPSKPGKPLNIGRALRVACTFYRARKRVALAGTVPPIAAVDGAVVDIVQANKHTAAARASRKAYTLPPLTPTTVDVAAVVRNTAALAWSMAHTPDGSEVGPGFKPAGLGPWSGGRGMWRLAELAAGVPHPGPYAGRLCDECLY